MSEQTTTATVSDCINDTETNDWQEPETEPVTESESESESEDEKSELLQLENIVELSDLQYDSSSHSYCYTHATCTSQNIENYRRDQSDATATATATASTSAACNDTIVAEALLHYPHVQCITLSNTQLSDISALGALSQLRELNVSDNKLSELLNLEAAPRNLQSIDFSSNAISTLNSRAIQRFRFLRSVRLSHNRINYLDAFSQCRHLRELIADNNNIASIDALRCRALQTIDVHANAIDSISGMRDLPFLRQLNIANNCLYTLDGIAKHTSLESLDISNNSLSNWKHLEQLQQLPLLRELDCRGNPCVSKKVETRFRLIYMLPQLQVLNGQSVTASERFLADELHEEFSHIDDAVHQLLLPNGEYTTPEEAARHEIEIRVPSADVAKLMNEQAFWIHLAENGELDKWTPLMSHVNRLRHSGIKRAAIEFNNVDLGDAGLWALGESITDLSTAGIHVASIKLFSCLQGACRNPLSDAYGLKHFLAALRSTATETLRTLWLPCNGLGIREGEMIAALIRDCTQLVDINFAGNRLGAHLDGVVPHTIQPCPGLVAITDAIAECKSQLHTLNLAYNDIGTEGIFAISTSVLGESPLRELFIGGNDVDDLGASMLASALEHNTRLATLNLERDLEYEMELEQRIKSVPLEGIQTLFDTVRVHNRTLQNLSFAFNEVAIKYSRAAHRCVEALSQLLQQKDAVLQSLDLSGVFHEAHFAATNRTLELLSNGIRKNCYLKSFVMPIRRNDSGACIKVQEQASAQLRPAIESNKAFQRHLARLNLKGFEFGVDFGRTSEQDDAIDADYTQAIAALKEEAAPPADEKCIVISSDLVA
jgi:Leucine-rich repeat (LRR) protein